MVEQTKKYPITNMVIWWQFENLLYALADLAWVIVFTMCVVTLAMPDDICLLLAPH